MGLWGRGLRKGLGSLSPKVPGSPARVIVATRLSLGLLAAAAGGWRRRLAAAAGPRRDQPEADG